jgi:hypothetical protein
MCVVVFYVVLMVAARGSAGECLFCGHKTCVWFGVYSGVCGQGEPSGQRARWMSKVHLIDKGRMWRKVSI